jgi:hypothetical protein
VATLEGDTGTVYDVALSADGQLLASRLWETGTGSWVRTLRQERRYERLDITAVTGITDAQRTALLALCAIEQHSPACDPTGSRPVNSMQ